MIRLSEKLYNTLKWLTMVFLPALATFYVGLADVWNLPYPQKISATIMALVVFLGIFLQVNSAQYRADVLSGKSIDPAVPVRSGFIVSNNVYDLLKWVATIFLPAFSTLYVGLSTVWNLPYTAEVTGTIAALVLFLGAVLQVSSFQYRASLIVVTGDDYPENPLTNTSIFAMSNNTYDILKFIAQAVLPGFATMYVALAGIWNLPYGEEIASTIMAVVLFMNAVLQISTAKYNAAVRNQE